MSKLYARGTLSNFVYTYYVQNKNNFAAYKKPTDFARSFKMTDKEWEALKTFAINDSINLEKILPKDKADLLKRIPAMFARQIWRYDGYYQVKNTTDDFILKAIQLEMGKKLP